MKIERFYSHAVACQNQATFGLRPDRRREHSAQPAETIFIPLEKRVEKNFGVTMADKLVAFARKFRAQFAVIIDFPVEYEDRVTVRTSARLRSSFQINNLQTNGAKRHKARLMDPLPVRAAMNQTCR